MDSSVLARRELMRMEELRSKLARLRLELMRELVRRALSNVFFISSMPGAARNTTNGMNSGRCKVALSYCHKREIGPDWPKKAGIFKTWAGSEELEALGTGVEDGGLAGVDDGLDGVVARAVEVGPVLAVLQELVVLDGKLHVLIVKEESKPSL